MKRTTGELVLALALITLAACGDSTGLEPDDVAGTWTATEWVLTNPLDASQTFDVLAAGGSFSITFREDSTFTSTVTDPPDPADTDTGTFSFTTTTITVAETGQGSPTIYATERDGDTMTFTNTDADHDWDDDGTDDDATERIVLAR